MNIKTANRLMELRKEKGYTQESLADALGISRQAVSKWERAEASPDTDNLILLAKLYNVSLDELLDLENSNCEDIKEESSNEETTKKEGRIHLGRDGLHVIDTDGDEVHIDFNGINISEKDGDTVEINSKGVKINPHKKSNIFRDAVFGGASLIAVIIYLVLGFSLNLWHPAWTIFLLVPVISSIVDVIIKKRLSEFCYPLLVVASYLFVGFCYNGWHPYWILFLTIPVFYCVLEPLEKLIHKDYDKVEIKVEEKEDKE